MRRGIHDVTRQYLDEKKKAKELKEIKNVIYHFMLWLSPLQIDFLHLCFGLHVADALRRQEESISSHVAKLSAVRRTGRLLSVRMTDNNATDHVAYCDQLTMMTSMSMTTIATMTTTMIATMTTTFHFILRFASIPEFSFGRCHAATEWRLRKVWRVPICRKALASSSTLGSCSSRRWSTSRPCSRRRTRYQPNIQVC